VFSGSPVTLRPTNPTPDALRRSGNLGLQSLYPRSSADPGLPLAPGRRAGDLIAFFEDKTTDVGGSHSRIPAAPGSPRSPSPYLQSTLSMAYGSSYGSRPSSPAKSRSSASSSGSASHSMTSLLSSPGLRALTSTSEDLRTYRPSSTGDYLSPSTLTGTFTNTFSQRRPTLLRRFLHPIRSLALRLILSRQPPPCRLFDGLKLLRDHH